MNACIYMIQAGARNFCRQLNVKFESQKFCRPTRQTICVTEAGKRRQMFRNTRYIYNRISSYTRILKQFNSGAQPLTAGSRFSFLSLSGLPCLKIGKVGNESCFKKNLWWHISKVLYMAIPSINVVTSETKPVLVSISRIADEKV